MATYDSDGDRKPAAALRWDPVPWVPMVECPVCFAPVGENCKSDHGIAHEGRVRATLEGLDGDR